jgi:DNA segregation ATPase FtsK/SpoIIIE, S-DNA-T family
VSAKRTRRKGKRKLKNGLKFELFGLLFITLAIFSSGISAIGQGFIPRQLEHLSKLFFGFWFTIPALFLFGLGIYLMIKRKWPNFLHTKLLGFYIIFSSLLLFTHVQRYEPIVVNGQEPSIIKTTWSHYTLYISGEVNSSFLGGGLIGAFLFAFSVYLFSPTGAKILSVFGILIGILFLTQISFGDLLKKFLENTKSSIISLVEKFKNIWAERKNAKELQKAQEREVQQILHEEEELAESTSEPIIIEDFTEKIYSEKEFESDSHSVPEIKPKPSTIVKQEEDNESDASLADVVLPLTEIENKEYKLPSIELLNEPIQNSQQKEKSKIQATVKKLERTFESFGVKAKVAKVHVGPSVTKYEVYPSAGVKVSKIVSLHDDLALALAAKDLRIEAPIPGKSAIGIEVPNQEVAMVSLKEVLEASNIKGNDSKLLFALGRNISGDAVFAELNKMPHLLIAGSTGSGKSVCVNGIITSILMRAKPHEVKMMMIDPKKVELNVYNGIPHLLTPVVTDPKKASRALKKVVDEMERRYDLFSDTGTRNIEGYNEYIRRWNNRKDEKQPLLPYIVVLIDELADLMMVASSDVEDAITRLAQMARAAGIHLIIATQRPSVDVITGVIKANIPSRIAFSVSSSTDSRTILDMGGAEKLLGRGDMLFLPVGASKPTRIQGAFLSDEEVERIVNHCIEQQKVQYNEEMIPDDKEVFEEVEDELFDDAVQLVIEMQSASVSMLQRRFRIGYTRAARLIDAMEERGIVGPYEGSKPRKVLITNIEEEKTS